jgi:thiosulfate/3-mercaptopyruvate sulfurtransferase
MSIIAPEDLIGQLDDSDVRIVDARWYLGQPLEGRRRYGAGHLPGAVFVDLDRDLSAAAPGEHPAGGRHPLPDPASFAARLAALGIGSEHRVVVYDDSNGTVAARMWWMLDDLGHPDVSLLDGGLRAWLEAGGALSTEVPVLAPAKLDLGDRWTNVITRQSLVEGLAATRSLRLLDLRAPERYRGEVEPVDRVPGHIPGARNAPTGGNLRPDGRFLDAALLASRYAELGSDEGPIVVSCGSGVTACHAALAMRIAGLAAPLLYAGSYSDWTAAGLPVAIGSEPGALGPT